MFQICSHETSLSFTWNIKAAQEQFQEAIKLKQVLTSFHNLVITKMHKTLSIIHMGYFMGSQQLKILKSLKIFSHLVFHEKNMFLKF